MNGKNVLSKLNGFLGPHPSTSWTSPLIYREDIIEPVPNCFYVESLVGNQEQQSDSRRYKKPKTFFTGDFDALHTSITSTNLFLSWWILKIKVWEYETNRKFIEMFVFDVLNVLKTNKVIDINMLLFKFLAVKNNSCKTLWPHLYYLKSLYWPDWIF